MPALPASEVFSSSACPKITSALISMIQTLQQTHQHQDEEDEEEEHPIPRQQSRPPLALTETVSPRIARQWNSRDATWIKREEKEQRRLAREKQRQEGILAAAIAAKEAAVAAAAAGVRRSNRQALRPAKVKRPWRALMKGAARIAAEKEAGDGEEEEDDEKQRKKIEDEDEEEDEMEEVRHRTVGEVEVQVFRNILPRSAIDLIMKGEEHAVRKNLTTSSGSRGRNPWPGINAVIKSFVQTSFANKMTHPYIAEISSRCDSAGPPQRLDLCLTPSGVNSLLPPEAIQAVDAIVYGLKRALLFKGRVTWDSHLVLVLPGAPPQKYHVDSSRSWFYFTLIFPLTKDPEKAGRTQFHESKDQPEVPVGVGDVLVFDGKRKHRGSGNETKNHVRVFLYIAVYSGTDWN